MNRITKTIVALTASLVGSSVVAQTLSVPNTFQAGMPARAAEVNANFSTIANGVNDNAVQIAALTEQLNTLRDRVDYCCRWCRKQGDRAQAIISGSPG